MGHLVREKPWGVIDLNLDNGQIFFQERWEYEWLLSPGVPAWTLTEKRRFHNALDTQIWSSWSNRIRFRTVGVTPFCRRFARVHINFDVRWVTARPHWTVKVRKLPTGSTPTTFISNVDSARLVINLDSADLARYRACNTAGRCRDFRAVPHEFGHTFPGVGDEYGAGAPHMADTGSIMNIGDEIRQRHLQPLLNELNAMLPGCTFSYP